MGFRTGFSDYAFSLTLEQISAMSIAEAFALAGGVLVAFALLAAMAVLLSRWLSHSLDLVFEVLLLLALGGLLAWLYLRTGGIPGLGL